MSLAFIAVFSATVFVASVTPGPSMLLALDHGIRYGRRRSLESAFGNVCGTLVQSAASLAGLGAVLAGSEILFSVIRWAGAAYLAYLGIKIIIGGSLVSDSPAAKTGKRKSLFFQAFFVTLGNPKAIFFFSALYPQFIDSAHMTVPHGCVMISITLIITFVCMMLYASAGDRIKALFKRRRLGRALSAAVGGSLIAIGAKIAFDRR
ncbi:MAG TPA: LysE family translocator [Spirochaetota bacterium]|nr:LysE family translocator [Spirochaetota bacterium]